MSLQPGRLVQAGIVVVMVAIGLGFAAWGLSRWSLEDTDAYLGAAQRLLAGEPLYPPPLTGALADGPDVYRYAPWFAVLWMPFTALPREVVLIGWTIVLLVASAVAVAPLIAERRAAGLALAGLCGGLLIWTVSRGNAHPVVIAMLVLGAPRRSGPLWVALAASLKAVPILYVLAYAARREWGRALVAVLITAILVAPMPLLGYDFGRSPGVSLSLHFQLGPSAWLIGAVVAVAVAGVAAFACPRYAWVAASAAAILALPRLIFYDFTYVMVGADPRNRGARGPGNDPATRDGVSRTFTMINSNRLR